MNKNNRPKSKATYSLEEVSEIVRSGRKKATEGAIAGLNALGLNLDQMWDVIANLTDDSFHKTMIEEMSNGDVYLDVYKPFAYGQHIYTKFKITRGRIIMLVVTSFKER